MSKNNQPICKTSVSGTKRWFLNEKLHRLDGPAVEYFDGDKLWFLHDRLHRLDGPAVEYIDGDKEWWVDGDQIQCSSQKEFKRLLKLKALW